MSDIITSKPQILYEHVLELKNLCYRVKQEAETEVNNDNFMLLSCQLLQELVESLHIQIEMEKDGSVLHNIHIYIGCFEKHILGTNNITENTTNPTLEDLITNIESIKVRMQQRDSYCSIL